MLFIVFLTKTSVTVNKALQAFRCVRGLAHSASERACRTVVEHPGINGPGIFPDELLARGDASVDGAFDSLDFLKTENGRSRCFHVDIDENGNKIGIEAEPKMITACAAQRERDRYRHKVMTKLNITVVSANALVSVPGEDDLELIDTVADEDVDLEAEAMHDLDLEILKKALQALTKEEYRIIHCLYLSKSPMSEKEIAKHLGMTQQAVSKRKRAIFEKLKKYF